MTYWKYLRPSKVHLTVYADGFRVMVTGRQMTQTSRAENRGSPPESVARASVAGDCSVLRCSPGCTMGRLSGMTPCEREPIEGSTKVFNDPDHKRI
ncbi:hypothetical protein Trydic_g20212 [Trypoxylus dichotomus]